MKRATAREWIVLKKHENLMTARLLILPCIFLWLGAAAQASDEATTLPYKLTTGFYQYSGADAQNGQAIDINLRHTSEVGNIWFGHYVSWAHELTQDRVGWDRSFPLGPARLMPSLQLASGGAWTSSVGVETGDSWYVGSGFGRTNLRDSVSLNFDPNDSYSVSGGYRWRENESASFVLVRDNRLHPEQQHLHLIYRTPLPGEHRLTADLLFKSGLVEDRFIERTGLSLTYDWPRWFVRVSYDPNANFTTQDLWRLAVGTRF
jgi:phenylpropionate dioxygenase-like ring-hydroxylating dioxygenase large terminal subunit